MPPPRPNQAALVVHDCAATRRLGSHFTARTFDPIDGFLRCCACKELRPVAEFSWLLTGKPVGEASRDGDFD